MGSARALNTSSTPHVRIGDRLVTCQPSARRSVSSADAAPPHAVGSRPRTGRASRGAGCSGSLGYERDPRSPTCSLFRHPDGFSVAMEQSPDMVPGHALQPLPARAEPPRVPGRRRSLAGRPASPRRPTTGGRRCRPTACTSIAGGADVAYLEDRDGFEVELSVRRSAAFALESGGDVGGEAAGRDRSPTLDGDADERLVLQLASRRGTRPSSGAHRRCTGSTRPGRRAPRACRAPRPARRPARTRRSSRRTARRSTHAGRAARCWPWRGRG